MGSKSLDDMIGGYIDSREIIDRLAELETEYDPEVPYPHGFENEEDHEEYVTLRGLDQEGSSSFADWTYGVSLIPESDFTQYAQELAEDIGAIDRDAAWPTTYIDWDAAADALRMDYTEIEIGGTTYLGR